MEFARARAGPTEDAGGLLMNRELRVVETTQMAIGRLGAGVGERVLPGDLAGEGFEVGQACRCRQGDAGTCEYHEAAAAPRCEEFEGKVNGGDSHGKHEIGRA